MSQHNEMDRIHLPVSIVVTVYNGESTLRQCLSAILQTDYPKNRLEIIIIDDGSTDSSPHILEGLSKENSGKVDLKIVRQKNMGPAKSKSKGLEIASGKIVIMVSQDVYISKNYVANIEDVFKDESVGIAQGPIFPKRALDTPFYHCTTTDKPNPHYPTAAIAYRSKALDETGRYFDKRFTALSGGDDTQLAMRILKKGFKSKWVPSAISYHEVMSISIKSWIIPAFAVDRFVLLVKLHPELRKKILGLGIFWAPVDAVIRWGIALSLILSPFFITSWSYLELLSLTAIWFSAIMLYLYVITLRQMRQMTLRWYLLLPLGTVAFIIYRLITVPIFLYGSIKYRTFVL